MLTAARLKLLAMAAALLLTFSLGGIPAQASATIRTEHFCWGVTLEGKNTHSTADECLVPHFGIIEAEAWSPQHSICLEFALRPHERRCSFGPESHVVIKDPVVCSECANYLNISNNAEGPSTVYGNVTWTDGVSESPPPPPLKKVDELGFVRFNQASGNSHLDLYTGAPAYTTLASSSDTGYPAISDPSNVQALPIDINGDGIKELAFVRLNQSSGNAHISVYTDAPGYKTLTADCDTAYPAVSDPQNVQVMAIDTNGDGVSELAFVRLSNTTSGDAHIDIYKGAPCYQTLYSSNDLTYPAVSDPQNVHVLPIDVNGDFRDELMFVRYNYFSGNAQAVTYSGSPAYTTTYSNCTTAYPAISDPQNVETVAIDTNGDGIDELGFLRYNYSSGNTQLVTYSNPPCYTTLASANATAYPAVSDPQNIQGMAINTNGS
jgi:hypothetical protein